MFWRMPSAATTVIVLVVTTIAMSAVSGQRTTGPSADAAELSCTAATYPCLRTRYIDLVLDFTKLEDFDLSSSQPTASPWSEPRSTYRDAIDGDQMHLPFLRSLCFSTIDTFSPVVDVASTSSTDGSSTTTLESPDAAMVGAVRSFPEYQAYYASQHKLPVSSAFFPTRTGTTAPTTEGPAISPPPSPTTAITTLAPLSTAAASETPAPTAGAARDWVQLGHVLPGESVVDGESTERDDVHESKARSDVNSGVESSHYSRRSFGKPLADNTTTSFPSTTASPASTVVSTATPGITSSPTTTTAAPSSPSPPSTITVGSPVTQPICQPVRLATVLQGMTSSFPANETAANIAINGVVTSASLIATPGVRLMPFRSAGGHVVIPFSGSPATVAAGAEAQRRQYLVTLAVTTTGARAQSLFSVLQSFSVRPPTNADGTPSSSSVGAAATNDNILYQRCGLYDVIWLTTSDYELLYFNRNSGSRPSLFAAVGFGQSPSEGLTLPWILLLVIGTCLAALVIYAFCIRRQADANRKEGDGVAEGGAESGGLDAGERSDDDVDDDYEQELQATEAEQLIQQNIRTVWQEKDLKTELRGAVLKKLLAEQEAIAAEQIKLQGTGGVGGNRSPAATSDNGSGSDNDTGAGKTLRAGANTGVAGIRNTIATRLMEDGTKLVVLQPLHESHQGSTQHVIPRRAGGKANVSRTQLLPNSSYFEETLELAPEYNLPPDSIIMRDEAALAAFLRTKREERRRRDDDLGVGLNPGGVIGLPGGAEVAGGQSGRKSGSRAGSDGQSPTTDFDGFDMMNLPPAAIELSASELEEQEALRRATDAAASSTQNPESPGGAGGRVESKPIGLAARRMANMMSNMRFAAVPSGVLRLPSRHEMIGQLSGGSASSHLAMAGAADDTTDRLMRQRFSKLYFAPQALVDQPADDSDDSAPSSPSLSPRARRAVPELRFQEITKNLNGGEYSPASPMNRRDGGGGGSDALSPPQIPMQEGAAAAASPASTASRASPPAFRVEL
jgi:hypothetical protein